MNDNFKPLMPGQEKLSEAAKEQIRQVAELQEFAMRAVLKPESLTMGEIQEVGLGYLKVAEKIRRRSEPQSKAP